MRSILPKNSRSLPWEVQPVKRQGDAAPALCDSDPGRVNVQESPGSDRRGPLAGPAALGVSQPTRELPAPVGSRGGEHRIGHDHRPAQSLCETETVLPEVSRVAPRPRPSSTPTIWTVLALDRGSDDGPLGMKAVPGSTRPLAALHPLPLLPGRRMLSHVLYAVPRRRSRQCLRLHPVPGWGPARRGTGPAGEM